MIFSRSNESGYEIRTAGSPPVSDDLGQKQALGSMPMTRIDGANDLKQGLKSLKEDKKAKKLKH